MSAVSAAPASDELSERRFPPVAELGVASLALIVIGGIYMASYSPRRPPLGIPVFLTVAAGVLLLVNVVMLAVTKGLAWDKFFLVFRWSLLAYLVAAGLIEFAFVRNHTRGGGLVVLTVMLLLFAVDVPLIISFTVARYQSIRVGARPHAA